MPSIQSTSSFKRNLLMDDNLWIIHIRRTLEEELETEIETPVSIFNVPKLLMATDPKSYTPQEVAIGPYHHWTPELYEMERYKLAAAKGFQRQLQGLEFHHVVDQLGHLVPKIRASYHKVIETNGEALVWMMAIDASFLLEFLHVYAVKEGAKMTRISSRMSHLVDYGETKSAHNAILRDIVMLENQMPLMVLRKMLELQFLSLDSADEMLVPMLVGFSKELSPFKMVQDVPNINVSVCSHLLHYLYDVIVPELEVPREIINIEAVQDQYEINDKDREESPTDKSGYIKNFLSEFWKTISKLNKSLVVLLKKLIFLGPVKVIIKLAWTIISNLPGILMWKKPIEALFFSEDKDESKEEGEGFTKAANNKLPLIEEITIPSVTELFNSGVRFQLTNGNLLSINFDVKNVTLYLPILSLDVNTEVVLRNLVAYEASSASGALVLTRYTELMNGIIDSEEDAKLLRDKGIILNYLKSDREVADLWNGMSKSIKLTKVPFLDKVIEDVNIYYNNCWKVRANKFIKCFVFGSWQIFTLLACILLLVLMTLQFLFSVYRCVRLLNTNAN